VTPHPRRFRFGVELMAPLPGRTWASSAQWLESAGYSTLFVPDHFHEGYGPISAMTAAALATTTLRVSCTVYANDFRHPALVAKEAASIDLLSGGRFECGIGAGWHKVEYDWAGIPFDPAGMRVSRLAEAIEVLKGLWGEGPLTYAGRYYTITDLDGVPKPLQRPHPPLFIGGGGKRLLSLAAQTADIVGILGQALPGGGVEIASLIDSVLAEKAGWVRAAAGARFAQLELNMLLWRVELTTDREAAAQSLADAGPFGGLVAGMGGRPWLTADEILASPYFQLGTVDQIAASLHGLRERHGISYFTVFAPDMATFAPVVAQLVGH
jgi:probable F420-dependent oxidoreductase